MYVSIFSFHLIAQSKSVQVVYERTGDYAQSHKHTQIHTPFSHGLSQIHIKLNYSLSLSLSLSFCISPSLSIFLTLSLSFSLFLSLLHIHTHKFFCLSESHAKENELKIELKIISNRKMEKINFIYYRINFIITLFV